MESEKTEEEIARAAERRREQGKKLQEIAAAKRLEKVGPNQVLAMCQDSRNFLLGFAERERPAAAYRTKGRKRKRIKGGVAGMCTLVE